MISILQLQKGREKQIMVPGGEYSMLIFVVIVKVFGQRSWVKTKCDYR